MSAILKTHLHAVPPYFGSKRQLLRWIANKLQLACPPNTWHKLSLTDLFMGSGTVALWAKAQGFKNIIANDLSQRSQILGTAFLANNRVTLNREDVLWLTQPRSNKKLGLVEKHYCPHVFSTRHARALDQGFYWARRHPDPTKQALLLVVMWHLATQFVSFATSLGTSNRPFAEALDGRRNWDDLNPKRFTDGSLRRLCKPVWTDLDVIQKRVNRGVSGGSSVQLMQEDALTVLPKLKGDILYLDPPYAGTASYERSNAVLDVLLSGKQPKTKPPISPFSKGTEALEGLLSMADHYPVWLVSYGNKTLSLSELEDLVRRHAGKRVVKGFSKQYQHLRHVSKNTDNQELLILAYPKGGL